LIEDFNSLNLPGQTPLDQLDIDGLIAHAHNKKEVDEAEARNILEARKWIYARSRKFTTSKILTLNWIIQLHKNMFDDVWSWGGEFRTTAKNIGVPAYKIRSELQEMLNETNNRLANKAQWGFSNQEIALRLAHKAVLIHPFANGNGRWSRELADAFLTSLGEPRFSWGITLPLEAQHQKMIEAIKDCDLGNFKPFMEFAIH